MLPVSSGVGYQASIDRCTGLTGHSIFRLGWLTSSLTDSRVILTSRVPRSLLARVDGLFPPMVLGWGACRGAWVSDLRSIRLFPCQVPDGGSSRRCRRPDGQHEWLEDIGDDMELVLKRRSSWPVSWQIGIDVNVAACCVWALLRRAVRTSSRPAMSWGRLRGLRRTFWPPTTLTM